MELDKIRLTTDDGRPLWWDHFPLVWTCPPSTSPAVIAAYARGIFEWQKKADLESIGLFRPYNAIDTRADVLLAGDLFPVDLDPSTGFDLPDVGFLSPHHAAPEFRRGAPDMGRRRSNPRRGRDDSQGRDDAGTPRVGLSRTRSPVDPRALAARTPANHVSLDDRATDPDEGRGAPRRRGRSGRSTVTLDRFLGDR